MFRSNSHQVLPGWWCNGNIGLHNPHEKPHHGLLQCFAMAHNSCQPHHHLWPPQLYKWSLEHPQCSFVGAAHDQPVSWPFIEHTKCCKTTYLPQPYFCMYVCELSPETYLVTHQCFRAVITHRIWRICSRDVRLLILSVRHSNLPRENMPVCKMMTYFEQKCNAIIWTTGWTRSQEPLF